MENTMSDSTNSNFRTLVNGVFSDVTVAAVNASKAGNGVNIHVQFSGVDMWLYVASNAKGPMGEVNARTIKACKKAMKKSKLIELAFWTSGDYDNVALAGDYAAHRAASK